MDSFIHVGGLDIQYADDREDPSCIEQLKKWILEKKLEYKEKYIHTQANSTANLKIYEEKLEKLGITLIEEFKKDVFDEKVLKENGWPKELIECMNESEVSIPVIDSIEVSFIRFPNTPCLDHAKLLELEMKKTATQ